MWLWRKFLSLKYNLVAKEDKILEEVTGKEYQYGFTTNVETDKIPKGLDENVIKLISQKKMSQNGY